MLLAVLVAYKRQVVTFNKHVADSYIAGKSKLTAKAENTKD